SEQKKWLAWARGLAASGRELVAIVATHHHADHVGGAAVFARELGLPLWAHEETKKRIDAPVARALDEDDEIDLDGPTPQRWRVMFTPGHAPGHICLYEASLGAVVVGDMVASVGTILIEPREGDMQRYLVELGRLEKLEAKAAFPAHGATIAEPSRLFRAYQIHRAMREGAVLSAVEKKPGGTLEELLPLAYEDTNRALWPIAKLSLEAHLVKLVREGRVKTDGERYETTD
ncbi:MAG TPA: MBL fold metallo-hydrolase, partial [Polyangiaceae bacterium]|nr:MBL fold metallo-hydrolase [Polyangiaceae bacterium]